ncbi:MAG: hypothetical protein E3J78_04125 [Candidatus Cloacimonadota bacterium]|nr:MAG: hypothetical protein E3J78_04125 [Candidatus Cloacimonadota bacterium]
MESLLPQLFLHFLIICFVFIESNCSDVVEVIGINLYDTINVFKDRTYPLGGCGSSATRNIEFNLSFFSGVYLSYTT